MIKYSTHNGKTMALIRSSDKVYMGTGPTQSAAFEDLIKRLNEDKFAAYDFSLPTSAHNSSVRTRV
jgi:hypothetical protein